MLGVLVTRFNVSCVKPACCETSFFFGHVKMAL